VVLHEIEGEFEPLAREFVQYLGFDLEESSDIIRGYIKKAGGKWPPRLLGSIKDGLDILGIPKTQ